MRWLLENAAKAIGLLSFSLLALSVVHDWGYFYVVGSRFRTVQTTYDYIANAIDWLPPLLLSAIVAAAIAKLLPKNVSDGFEDLRQRDFARRWSRFAAAMLAGALLSLSGMWFLSYPTYLI